MTPTTADLIRTDFASFVRKAFHSSHGERLGGNLYIEYLCYQLHRVVKGEKRRVVINLPPRHLKTFLGACFAAWFLAHNPAARIMVITYREKLAEKITYQIREILQSPWFKKIFETRIAANRSGVGDFSTDLGGGVLASSIGGALAGYGADVIIFDDPLDLRYASNPERVQIVNERFDNLVMSRLNRPKTGRVVIIAHRLNEQDLSAHVREQGGWRHIVLPFRAVCDRVYDLGYAKWHRKKGELLRPDFATAKDLKKLKDIENPSYRLFYQQGKGRDGRIKICEENFPIIPTPVPHALPIILSIDPGQSSGANSSFSVIQAWMPCGSDHFLIEQWREQANYETLRKNYWRFFKRYRPCVALIEATANGPALISDAARKKSHVLVVGIKPKNRSKMQRLIPHMPTIEQGRIKLPEHASWRDDFVTEFILFPSGDTDDQVDATTQYLNWVSTNRVPKAAPARNLGAGIGWTGELRLHGGTSINTPHGILLRGDRGKWR